MYRTIYTESYTSHSQKLARRIPLMRAEDKEGVKCVLDV
jgi:hypothetical protein